ncbi:sec-independent protein translocase protein TATC, chloroplastic-like [Dorcoceras hygrometricum]|uniref:Sec-independent protein translocase protein TATC, chloroplastic-like n=1 Tax=Dorcoceras hygrometricum TaxID=472368 RepID=A0A2Z7BTS1_9LAMI|nr:sec-independent protein translocase protein TATC, chloroplastic-like [Dorcoceras hygrometricum]
MGSTGILISNPHVTNKSRCLQCMKYSTPSKITLPIKNRRTKFLVFSSKNHPEKFDRIVCSAVEDVAEKQRESGSGSVNGAGSSVEDRPGILEYPSC